MTLVITSLSVATDAYHGRLQSVFTVLGNEDVHTLCKTYKPQLMQTATTIRLHTTVTGSARLLTLSYLSIL